MSIGDTIVSFFKKLLQNVKKWAFSPSVKNAQSTLNKREDVIDAIGMIDEPFQSNLKNLLVQAENVLGERQVEFLYDQVSNILVEYAGEEGYDWSKFINNLSRMISALHAQQQQDVAVTEEAEERKNKEVPSDIENIIYNYIKNNAIVDQQGTVIGTKPAISVAPKEVLENRDYFDRVVRENAVNEAIANGFLAAVEDSLVGEKDSYLAKQEKYKDLDVIIRGDPRGRRRNDKLVDTIKGYTPQAVLFMDNTPMFQRVYSITGANSGDQMAHDSVMQSISRYLGPFEDVYKSDKGKLYRMDYRDGRIQFFIENPEYLDQFVKKNSIDSSEVAGLEPNELYSYLLNNYGNALFDEMSSLIRAGDETVAKWVAKKSRKMLENAKMKAFHSKGLDVGGEQGGGEGKSIERSNKGKASEFAPDEEEELEQTKQYATSVFNNMVSSIFSDMKGPAKALADHYEENNNFLMRDVIYSLLEAAYTGIDSLSTKNKKKIDFQNPGSFKSFVTPKKVLPILSKKGKERLKLREEIESRMKKGESIQTISLDIDQPPAYLEDTIRQSPEEIESQYFFPDKKGVGDAMREEGRIWKKMIEYVGKNGIDINPNDPGVKAKIDMIKSQFKIIRSAGNIINIETASMIKKLSGIKYPQDIEAAKRVIDETYLNENNKDFAKDYYNRIGIRFNERTYKKLGYDFKNWKNVIIELTKEQAKRGDVVSSIPREIFLYLMKVHNRFKEPSDLPEDYWSHEHVPGYYEAVGKPMPQKYRDIIEKAKKGRKTRTRKASDEDDILYNKTIRAIEKIAYLSRIMNGMIKLSHCKSRQDISDEIDRIANNAKLNF